MLTDLTIEEFIERVASGEPVPGGGSVSALVAAISGALSEMVGRLTIGRKNDPLLDKKMSTLIDTATRLRTKLARDVDKDSDAYSGVLKAYRMPKATEEEQETRGIAIQEALKEATRVPLSVAESGVTLLSLAGTAVTEGNSNAMTDAAVAALMARSAVMGAIYNVWTNLASIKDTGFRDSMGQRADALEREAGDVEKSILTFVENAVKKPA
jgi:formiminotetrahydrofolate cyclodeaminase